MRLKKIFILFVIIILTSFSFVHKDSFSYYYGNKVFLKKGKSTIYMYKGTIKRLYFDYMAIDLKYEGREKGYAFIRFPSENKLVKVVSDNSTRVALKNSPNVLYLTYESRNRKKIYKYSHSPIYLTVKLGEKNKDYKADPNMIKRVKLANYLAKIQLMGGDHLKYSQKMLQYLMKNHNVVPTIEEFNKRSFRNWRRQRRRDSIDLYSLLSGGLAIRESLQTETIRAVKKAEETIPLEGLKTPTVKSHPFKEMLKGRQYKFFPLANACPYDFYYMHFINMRKALDFFDYINEVGGSIYQKYSPKSVDFMVKEKVLRQLAIKENKWARKFYFLLNIF
ncbi:hypothetical protein ACFL20_13020 [Spirochaetota bacterium]